MTQVAAVDAIARPSGFARLGHNDKTHVMVRAVHCHHCEPKGGGTNEVWPCRLGAGVAGARAPRRARFESRPSKFTK